MNQINNCEKEILDLLNKEIDDLYLASICKKLPYSKTLIHRNLSNLLVSGYIKTYGKNPKFYSITAKGKALGQGFTFHKRTHGIQLTIPIIQKPISWVCEHSNFVKISDEIKMRNWREEIRGRWQGQFMMVTPSSITIHLTEFFDPNVRINMFNALWKGKQFCKDMELMNPGLKLGKINKGSLIHISAQEHALELPNKDINSVQGKTFVIDWSNGVPEIEFKDNKNSVDYMDNFADFIDSLATGEITSKDITNIRGWKKKQDTRRVFTLGILHAKHLWSLKYG